MSTSNENKADEIDLSRLDDTALDDLVRRATEQKVERTIESFEPLRNEYNRVVTEITEMARPYGLTADRFLSNDKGWLRKHLTSRLEKKAAGELAVQPKRRVAKVPQKYQSPENPELQWTGRGNKPHWVREFEAAGGKLENIEIKATPES